MILACSHTPSQRPVEKALENCRLELQLLAWWQPWPQELRSETLPNRKAAQRNRPFLKGRSSLLERPCRLGKHCPPGDAGGSSDPPESRIRLHPGQPILVPNPWMLTVTDARRGLTDLIPSLDADAT